MKHLPRFLILMMALSFWSCRDTKEVEKAVETEVQQEKSVTKPIDGDSSKSLEESSEELDKEVQELESALQELDTI